MARTIVLGYLVTSVVHVHRVSLWFLDQRLKVNELAFQVGQLLFFLRVLGDVERPLHYQGGPTQPHAER